MVEITSGTSNAIKPFNYTPGTEFRAGDLWTQKMPLKRDVQVTMGNIYTKDANGYVVAPTAAAGVADLRRAAFQATESWTNSRWPIGMGPASDDTADADRYSSFAMATSFIVMYADADVIPGGIVDLAATGTVITANRVSPNATAARTNGTLGMCMDILAPTDDGTGVNAVQDRRRKAKTAAGDLVLVRLGVGVI